MSVVTCPEIKSVSWNPADYAANSASQQAWARELIARIQLRGDERVLDVGCGDGKVTAELAAAVPNGAATGIDASPAMIRFAREAFRNVRNLEFAVMDARRIQFDRSFDLVFSNAALHWVDDHAAFLRGASASLRTGGRLMVSCGGKGNAQDVFVALRAEMRLQRWRQFFRKMDKPYFFHRPEEYERWLPRFGFEPRQVRLVDKESVWAGRNGLVGWFRTTWLPYTQRIPEAQREEFIGCVVDRYLSSHPSDAGGRVRVKMVRLEIDAVRL